VAALVSYQIFIAPPVFSAASRGGGEGKRERGSKRRRGQPLAADQYRNRGSSGKQRVKSAKKRRVPTFQESLFSILILL